MNWKRIFNCTLSFLLWTLLSAGAGLAIGTLGILFKLTLEQAAALREASPWIICLLPLGGLLIAALYQAAGQPGGGSTNSVFLAVRDNQPMPPYTAPLIFVSTALTHLLGGSAGREGAALQLGGSVAGFAGRRLHLDERDTRTLTACGMSAAFSAIFGTPLAACVFSIEVISVGRMYYGSLLPCLLSALTGSWLAGALGLEAECFTLLETAEISPLTMLQTGALSVLFALLSVAVCVVFHQTPKLYARFIKNPYLRVAAGGFLVVGLTFLCRTYDYNGAGNEVISRAIAGEALPWAFLLKLLFTALTLGAGFKGGEIVPIFFIGSTFGCTIAPLLGVPASLGAAMGLVSVFCGATNCPIASVALAVELFGGQCVPLFALSCAISYMLSGYFGLYSEQKILYSKFHAKFIDRKTH